MKVTDRMLITQPNGDFKNNFNRSDDSQSVSPYKQLSYSVAINLNNEGNFYLYELYLTPLDYISYKDRHYGCEGIASICTTSIEDISQNLNTAQAACNMEQFVVGPINVYAHNTFKPADFATTHDLYDNMELDTRNNSIRKLYEAGLVKTPLSALTDISISQKEITKRLRNSDYDSCIVNTHGLDKYLKLTEQINTDFINKYAVKGDATTKANAIVTTEDTKLIGEYLNSVTNINVKQPEINSDCTQSQINYLIQ